MISNFNMLVSYDSATIVLQSVLQKYLYAFSKIYLLGYFSIYLEVLLVIDKKK